MWYVYILRSGADRNLYIGSTDNIRRRISEHNCGEVDSTKSRALFGLEAYIAVDKTKAIELEQYFKTGSGRALLRKRIL